MTLYRKSNQAVDRSKKNPSFLKSDEFIHTRLFDYDLRHMFIEMGPNCNLSCPHCMDNCGTRINGLPNKETVSTAMFDAIRAGVLRVCLGHGEPLRPENREVTGIAMRYSNYINTGLVTNCTFANSLEEALDWLNYLKANRFDLSDHKLRMKLSFGAVYPTNKDHFRNANVALHMAYPGVNLGKNISYQHIAVGDVDDGKERVFEMLGVISDTFGKRRMSFDLKEKTILMYPEFGDPFHVKLGRISPYGRARQMSFVQKFYPKKELQVGRFYSDSGSGYEFTVFSNGNVNFTTSGTIGRNISYGNVNKSHLGIILQNIRSDPVFQAFKLGGSALIYFTAQQADPNFVVCGRSDYDVLETVFEDGNRIAQIRGHLNKRGVVDTYKKMIASLDLRKDFIF